MLINFMKKAKITVIIAIVFSVSLPLFAARKQKKDTAPSHQFIVTKEGDFLSIKTAYFDILYEQDVDLKRVHKKLHGRRFYASPGSRPPALSGFDEKIAYRLNLLFDRVKAILGMYPAEISFKIKIFKDSQMAYDKFFEITKRKLKVKAFYSRKDKVMYTSESDISDSVIAHEMAHAICDHYFVVKPPVSAEEILARHVDAHLED